MTDDTLTTTIHLRDGREAIVRPLTAGDTGPLGDLFCSLSELTRSRYGPHPFGRDTAAELCAAVSDRRTVRFVAVLNDGTGCAEFIAYMILSRDIWQGDRERYSESLPWETTACFAPVVADSYQEQGIGGQMGAHVLTCARALGLSHVILMGGVLDDNPRARRLYEKLGFQATRSFWTDSGSTRRLNHDMVVVL